MKTIHRLFFVACLAGCLGGLGLAPYLRGDTPPYTVVSAPATEIKGSLIIVGGGAIPQEIQDEYVRLAGGKKARLVIIPTASASADGPDADKALTPWRTAAPEKLTLLHTRNRQRASADDFVKPIAEATGIWFGGGDQTKIADAYLGTKVEAELRKLLERGGVIGGTSAGAAIMSRLMIASGNPKPVLSQGLGLLPNVIIDQHFSQRKREPRLQAALTLQPGWVGIGIDEETALVVRGRTIKVLGKNTATVHLAASVSSADVMKAPELARPALKKVLQPGTVADLIALSRAALARAQAPFPPKEPPAPVVTRGTLFIGGGGGLGDDIYTRFIKASGGPGGLFVVVPTANPDPLPSEPYDVKRLKALGVKNAQVVRARTPLQAEAPDVLALLQKANGVWFGGGRQWRYVDAYLDTKFEEELHALLARGGAIGGSSAGASIQADYLARGDPLGNLNIIAEGYERGLGFLKGVAIDQHFFKRKRTQDMTELMKVHPQLLGIGIDEGTVIVVSGEVMEVMGVSNVAVYDRKRPAVGDVDYELLPPGSRYNLKLRQRVSDTKGQE